MYSNGYGALGDALGGIFVLVYLLFYLIAMALSVLLIIANCKLFTKAGERWWKALIPGYNAWVLMRLVTDRNLLWFILFCIPGPNIVALCYLFFRIPIVFGKSAGWGVANIFLMGIMTIILGFSSSTEYVGY